MADPQEYDSIFPSFVYGAFAGAVAGLGISASRELVWGVAKHPWVPVPAFAILGGLLGVLWGVVARYRRKTTAGSIVDRLKNYLSSRIAGLPSGVTETELLAFESRYGVRLPADMQAYFLAVNGTNDNWADDCLLAFWPLQKVKPASEPAGLFIFADHSVSACEYAIRLSQTESEPCPVVVIGGPEPRVVADSFSEFVEIYLTGDFAKLLP